MNCFDIIEKAIKSKQRKQMLSHRNNIVMLTLLTVAVGGVVAVLLTENCFEEIKKVIIKNTQGIGIGIDKETKKKREEIRETFEQADKETMGDVGNAMGNALDDLEGLS